MLLTAAIGWCCLLSGCLVHGVRRINVTNQPAWWGSLQRNEVLRLTRDAVLDGDYLTFGAYQEIPEGSSKVPLGFHVTPEMFKANPSKYWASLHLIPKGTRFRCVKLERLLGADQSEYALYAEIMDGEFKGMTVHVPFAAGHPDKKGSLHLSPYMGAEPAEKGSRTLSCSAGSTVCASKPSEPEVLWDLTLGRCRLQ